MAYFLERVVPVAESAGVRLAVHPDDPPISPIRGIARILTSPEALKRVIDLVPSPANGVTLCQGTVSSMGVDVPAAIRLLGATGRVFFVHFRDVRGGPEARVGPRPTGAAAELRPADRRRRRVRAGVRRVAAVLAGPP